MMLDNPLKIAALVAMLILLRMAAGAWKKTPHRAFVVELLNSAIIAFFLVFLLIRPFLLQAFYIPSGSMVPTLLGPEEASNGSGDRILVNKFIYRLGPPRRGDIVVFRAPPQAIASSGRAFNGHVLSGSTDFIKRVIGLPGDEIMIRSNEGVFVNGELLKEPYIGVANIPTYDWPKDHLGGPARKPYVVPADHLFVLGDNRNSSNDSHLWQDPDTFLPNPALPMENVEGKSMVIFWPLNRAGRLTQ